MTDKNIRRATLDEIFEMDRRGELHRDDEAPDGPELGEDFWKNAVLTPAPPHDTIVLPVERAMMEWFKQEYPDYPQRMNEILREHMQQAQLKKAS